MAQEQTTGSVDRSANMEDLNMYAINQPWLIQCHARFVSPPLARNNFCSRCIVLLH